MNNNTSKKGCGRCITTKKTTINIPFPTGIIIYKCLNDFRIVIFINIYKNVKTLNYSSPRDLLLKTVSYNKFIIVIIRGSRYVSYNENYTEATVRVVIGGCSRLRRLWKKCEKLKCKIQEIVTATCYLKMRNFSKNDIV